MASLLATILMLASFSPSLAKEPVVSTTEWHNVQVIPCSEWFGAGYVDIIIVDDASVRITTFFDEDGNPKEFQAFAKWDGTVARSDNPDQTYKDMVRETFKGELPWDHQSEAVAGIAFHLTVPGKGRVASIVGRVIYDENGIPVFAAGLMHETVKDLCDGFAKLQD